MSDEQQQLWRGRAVLPQAPKDTLCRYVDDGKGVKGYVPYTSAEISAHQDWLASLPAKRERRALAAAQRRRDDLMRLKEELADLPEGGALLAAEPAARR